MAGHAIVTRGVLGVASAADLERDGLEVEYVAFWRSCRVVGVAELVIVEHAHFVAGVASIGVVETEVWLVAKLRRQPPVRFGGEGLPVYSARCTQGSIARRSGINAVATCAPPGRRSARQSIKQTLGRARRVARRVARVGERTGEVEPGANKGVCVTPRSVADRCVLGSLIPATLANPIFFGVLGRAGGGTRARALPGEIAKP